MTTNTTQFHASVPAEIYPENLIALAPVLNKEGTRGVTILNAAHAAMSTLTKTLAEIADTSKQTYVTNVSQRDLQQMVKAQHSGGKTPYPASAVSDGPNGMVIPLPEKVALQLNSAIDAAQQRACKSADAHMSTIKTVREALVSAVEHKLAAPAADRTLATEIRSHVKGMDPKQRLPFLSGCIKNGDVGTVAAVLSGKDFLSGLTGQQMAMVRKLAELHFAPIESSQRDATDAAMERLMKAGSMFVAHYGKHRALVRKQVDNSMMDKLAAGSDA